MLRLPNKGHCVAVKQCDAPSTLLASCSGRSWQCPNYQELRTPPSRRFSQCTRAYEHVELVNLAAGAAAAGDSSDLLGLLYNTTQSLDGLVADQLTGITPVTYAIILAAGLVTSLSPCTLSVLPLTIGYIGGYSKDASGNPANSLALQSASFALGLATTLALLGVASSLLGQAYGAIGSGAPLAVSVVAILMGLNLLEVLPLQLPSLDVDTRSAPVPPALQAYLAGLTFALAASPCSTPILATLLAFVSSTRDPVQGGSLLLAYTTGYVAPLLVAASFTGAIKSLLAFRKYSAWVTPASGVLLITGGSYSLLSRLLPA